MSDKAINNTSNAGGILADYIPPKELAPELGVKEITLAVWRMKQEGPPFVTIGRKIFYPRTGVREWIAARVRKPGPARGRGK